MKPTQATRLGAEMRPQVFGAFLSGDIRPRKKHAFGSCTLGAMYEGRVRILLISEGYKATAYRCQQCGYIVAQAQKECPFCGSKVKQIDAAVDLIVREVIDQGGQVEVVRDSPSLDKAGHIGALLRY